MKYFYRVDTDEIASDIVGIIDLIIAFRINSADIYKVFLEYRLYVLLIFLEGDSLKEFKVEFNLFNRTGTILNTRGNNDGAFSYSRDI